MALSPEIHQLVNPPVKQKIHQFELEQDFLRIRQLENFRENSS